MPKDMASFITSYEEATEEKTSWTICLGRMLLIYFPFHALLAVGDG